MQTGRIRVIGDEDAVMGLGLIGLEGQAVASLAEASKALAQALTNPEISLILITENWAEQLQDRVAETMLGATETMIVEIPSAKPGAQATALHERVERSLGLHLGD